MMRRREPNNIVESFESIRTDYAAAKASRYRRRRVGVSSAGSGADYHYRSESDYLRIIEEARDMDRNDAIVGQTIDRAVDNIYQEGFTLDVATGDTAIDDELEARWTDYAEDADQCDLAGEFTFNEQARMALRSSLVDGDHVALGTKTGALQGVESHRIRTPNSTKKNVVHGVLLDEFRRRKEYWITKDDIDPMRSVRLVSEINQVPVRDSDGNRQLFHVYNPKRITQTRGISALTPIFDACGMFEDINFAKLVQQQTVSCFAIFRTKERGSGGLPSINRQYGEQTTENLGGGATRRIEGIAPGMEITGEEGEKIEGFSPAVPNAEFFDHVRLILTLIGVNLGLPLVLVLMDGSETNFSGWRGALDEARKGFRRNQKWFAQRYHTPIYEWKVRQWLAEDSALASAASRSGIDIFGHRWNPPRWPYIQPNDDIKADILQIRGLLGSPRKVHANRGDNYYVTIDETIDDNLYAIRAAKQSAAVVNQEFPDDPYPVTWREVLAVPTPDVVNMSMHQTELQNTAEATKDE